MPSATNQTRSVMRHTLSGDLRQSAIKASRFHPCPSHVPDLAIRMAEHCTRKSLLLTLTTVILLHHSPSESVYLSSRLLNCMAAEKLSSPKQN